MKQPLTPLQITFRAQIHHDLTAPLSQAENNLSGRKNFLTLDFCLVGDFLWIQFDSSQPFGCFSSNVSRIIRKIKSMRCAQVEVMAEIGAIRKASASWKRSGSNTLLDLQCNFHGHSHVAPHVSKVLTAAKLFLQPPM